MDCCHSGTILDLKYQYEVNGKGSFKTYSNMGDTQCRVVMISGCKKDQTSADAYIRDEIDDNEHEYQGAMTASFIKNYVRDMSSEELVTKMRVWLKTNGYTQIPQLSSGKYIDLNGKYMLNEYN